MIKMLKKTIPAAIAAAMWIGGAYPTLAAPADSNGDLRMIPVIVNGYKVNFPDTEPYVNKDGRTMVPVRFVSEKLGGSVTWDSTTYTVIIKSGEKEIKLPVGSKVVEVNGKSVELDTSATLREDRTMVPLRFVSEVLDSQVDWDEDAHTVKLTDKAYASKVASGQVYLDDWGRELSKVWDPQWVKLSDLPDEFYSLPLPAEGTYSFWNNRNYLTEGKNVTKNYVDQWADHIKKYYEAILNFDYRTTSKEDFLDAVLAHRDYRPDNKYKIESNYGDYYNDAVANKLVVKGYASPEPSSVFYEMLGPVFRTKFKFMIESATDVKNAIADGWNASNTSDVPELKRGVWYEGFADVQVKAVYWASGQEKHYAVGKGANMFVSSKYIYTEVKE
jgi:hypothetical protein